MNRTKKLTQGAMLLAIVGALMVIDRQLSFVFENFIFMAAPVVVIIYAVMYSIRDGAVLCFGLLVIGVLFGSTAAYLYMPLAAIVGLGFAYGVKKDMNRRSLLIIAVALYVIGEVAITFAFMPLLGIDVATQISETSVLFEGDGVKEALSLISNNIESFMVMLFVASILLMGALEGFFTYFVSIVLLKRLKIKDIGISNALDLRISPALSYVLFLLAAFMYLLPQLSFLQEKSEVLYYVLMCASLIATFILLYYGYIFATVYLRLLMGKKSIFILLLLIFVLFPTSLLVLVLLGFLYGAGPLRTVVENKIEELKNEKKQ
ncbi:MAG: DUF2232 domain-containing protein [Erysipelotrichaceae bacterium]|nr:DUF2232 domain-containing protein [Erysipelotrichaceae bacterium]